MKIPAKPTSSPGRIDEFPPPLMRFPRSKSSRRSRSRASPMFIRKINTVNEATQEPSSPKVTCIGQVRVKCSKNKQSTPKTTTIRHCRWIWGTWASFFRFGCCKKSKKLDDLKRIKGNQREEGVIGGDNEVLISELAPRNVFLLTRCRSAPYRSSCLASKIWESKMEEMGKEVGIDEENADCEGSMNGGEEFKGRPLSLSRCKSEPARTGDKLFMRFSS